MGSAAAWTLVLNMSVMNAKNGQEAKFQVIEIKGFSSESDCEKAGEAAGEVFMLREGELNNLEIGCKKAR